MFQPTRLRHPDNDKLRLYFEELYQRYEVQQKVVKGKYYPLIENYLESTVNEIISATKCQPRTFIFRADLKFPAFMERSSMHDNNHVLSRFFRFFKYELTKASAPYRMSLRYIWAREQDTSDKPHYHLVIMLNKGVFDSIGSPLPDEFGSYTRQNIYHRMMRSWLKAMDFHHEEPLGQLITIGEHPMNGLPWTGVLARHDWCAINEAVYVCSYLCKAYTKQIGQGIQVFNTSQGKSLIKPDV
ncbi:inovirus-type Gp2 protein [Vreelandella aquamarina]|uniref:YagK/YfjJ domain-containing protein n=1 Tax=Vreelandella aquamarina TaxID=77097 RepID=UPI00384C643C